MPPSEIAVPQTDVEIDAALKNTDAELARKMRRLDTEVAASQKRMREALRQLSPADYLAAVEALRRRYPVSAELLDRAKARAEAVHKEHFAATREISPFTREGAAELTARTEALKKLEAEDGLYRIGVLSDSIEFTIRASAGSRLSADLERLEAMFRERQEAARQLENVQK